MCCGAARSTTTMPHSTRLQQLHQEPGAPATRELVLCSATLDAAILPASTPRHRLSDADYGHPVAQRTVGRTKPLTLAGDADPVALVSSQDQEGTLTLVVVNQVRRAQAIVAQLQGLPTLLLHSRFRRDTGQPASSCRTRFTPPASP